MRAIQPLHGKQVWWLLLLAFLSLLVVATTRSRLLDLIDSENPGSQHLREAIPMASESKDQGGATLKTCVVYTVYGGKPRYENEVGRSIGILKSNNPDVHVYLVSDNPALKTEHVDQFVPVNASMHKSEGPWYLRTLTTKEIVAAGECYATLAMDSHVTSCSTHLRKRMLELVSPSNFTLGTNVAHDTTKAWMASPLEFLNMPNKRMPHNCAILIKRGNRTLDLMDAWIDEIKNGNRDDQKALYKVLQSLSSSTIRHTMLPERFIMTFKPMLRHESNFPRMTFLADAGAIDLIHTYHPARIPPPHREDICRFLNSDLDPRLVFHSSNNANYSLVSSYEGCTSASGMDLRFCEHYRWLFRNRTKEIAIR